MASRDLPIIHPPRIPLDTELPLAGEQIERADAARNRALILQAAERLIGEQGVENVSMDAIACEAGVGKGTLFRRFGDRSGLMFALIDTRARDFQERMIRGEPPLGPGAPPVERLVAFGRGLLDLFEAHGEVLLEAEARGRFVGVNAGVYSFYRTHVEALVREADPRADVELLSEGLLAPLRADLFLYLRRLRELPLERIAAGYEDLVRRLLG